MASASMGATLRQIGRLFGSETVAGLTDYQLLERYVTRRDEAAFAALVGRHGPMVLRVCRAVLRGSSEVEDVFQATFLILIRKAETIRGRDALGGWLHKVAYRIALEAAAEAALRRAREQSAGELAAMKSEIDEFPEEMRRVLHEEIERLPDQFRLPVVLCDLEGLSRLEAARQLRWSEGTLRGRLARARARLRDRLMHRGLAVSSGVLASALGREASAVPAAWVDALAQLSVSLPAGPIVAGGAISATAALLARTTLRTMIAAHVQNVATIALVVIALGFVAPHLIPAGLANANAGDAGAAQRNPAAQAMERMPSRPAAAPAIPSQEAPQAKSITVRGRVLDPDGKPFEGAKLFLITYALKNPADRRVRAVTGADGRFQFKVSTAEFDATISDAPWEASSIVARAEGFAFGLANYASEEQELTLRLARDDVPIEGRVIDIQGRPVPGVSIQVRDVRATEDGHLTDWLAALKEEGDFHNVQGRFFFSHGLDSPPDPPLFPPLRTGPDGRFRIVGIGRERFVELHLEGPMIETAHVQARTRPGETLRVPNYKNSDRTDLATIHGPSFVHVAGPTRPMEGIVRDQDTGQPLAGITIQGERSLGNPIEYVSAITDARGHYRLVGLPRGREGQVTAMPPCDLPLYGRRKAALGYPPDESLPYLRSRVQVPDNGSEDSIHLDVKLKRGVWVTGRVVDKATGKPAPGRVEYFVFVDNPYLKQAPGFRWSTTHGLFTDNDGSFHLVAFPGPGLLATRANQDRYVFGVGTDTVKPPHKQENGMYYCHPYMPVPSNYHTLAEINPADGTRTLAKDLAVDPGRTLSLNVLGPDGKPMAVSMVSGLKDMVYWEAQPAEASSFAVIGLAPGKGRTISVRHGAKKLIGQVALKGDEKGAVSVSLQPWSTITGRLIDSEGQPWGGEPQLYPLYLPDGYARVGKDGRFRVEGLMPGQKIGVRLLEKGHRLGRQVIQDLILQPGEVKDLGDLTPKDEKLN